MADETKIEPTPQATGAVAETLPAATTASAPKPPFVERPDGTAEIINASAYKAIKDQAEDRGTRKAELARDEDARKLGFDSYAAMLAGVPKLRESDAAKSALERSIADLTVGKTAAERERAEALAAVVAKNREIKEREALFRSGFIDTEYGVHLAEEALRALPADQQATFDAAKFVEGLKASRPALFAKPLEVPVTTGAGTPPAALGPGAVAAQQAKEGTFDAMRAKPEELEARIRALRSVA